MSAADFISVVCEAQLHWKKVPNGYELSNGRARLEKRGKVWYLVSHGKELKLGRKASFDDAERIIDTYLEAITIPMTPIAWQQNPEKEPKRKELPKKSAPVPPGTAKYREPDWAPYQGVA